MTQRMTPQRYKKIREVLQRRQTDLTVCMEEVHKPHNVSAVVRTCDAVGVHKVHAIWEKHDALRRGTAMGSLAWVKPHYHDNIDNAITHFKAKRMQVLVTHLDDSAIDFREVDYTKPTALILGQEKTGATEQAINAADQSIAIPMLGMVQSLNVSVAAAIIMYEAQRQRDAKGMYTNSNLAEDECQKILFERGFPDLHAMCVARGISFPTINNEGEIVAAASWWKDLQFSA